MRKRYSASFKTEVVLEIFKEEKTMTQIASERGVHPNPLSHWKAEALQAFPSLFEPGHAKAHAQHEAQQRQLEEAYAEIGRLTTQVNWLKKKSGLHLIEN